MDKQELIDEKLSDLNHDGRRECRWCRGNGSISVDGGSLAYRCPDCGGSGEEEDDDDE